MEAIVPEETLLGFEESTFTDTASVKSYLYNDGTHKHAVTSRQQLFLRSLSRSMRECEWQHDPPQCDDRCVHGWRSTLL